MSLKKRLAAVFVVAVAALMIFGLARSGRTIADVPSENLTDFFGSKDTLYVWYTDDALTPYLTSAAVTYNESHEIRVVPVLQDAPEYLENVNAASLSGESMPDLYVLGHDSLEKAYLAGLATEVGLSEEDGAAFSLAAAYPDTAADAVTYQDKIIAYPFYFETSALLYNKSYLEAMEVDSLPATMEEMETFADSYDAPEQVEGVLKWDVTDIFYNYFFIGDAIDVGGPSGDDPDQIDIYNSNAVQNMRTYAELNQFFSIDTSEISYESVIQDFIDGKIVFTVATSDAIATLENAKAEGTFAYEYGVTLLPAIDSVRQTRPLSETQCIAVNGYSTHQNEANDFAWYLTTQYNDQLYDRSGKVAASLNTTYPYEALSVFESAYESSVPLPKMIETSNFWMLLERVFSQVWNGTDADAALQELAEQITQQVQGET